MKISRLLTIFLMFSFFTIVASNHSMAAKPIMFTSIPPQKWVVENIGKDLIDVHVLVDKGQDPHTFEPRPRQIVSLSAASIYFTMDMNFEDIILNKLLQNKHNLLVVDTTENIKKSPFTAEDYSHDNDDSEHHDEHDAHDEQDSHDEHDNNNEHDGHNDHDGHDDLYDPHVWLSPTNLIIMAKNVTEGLVQFDAKNKAIYEENLSLFIEKLEGINKLITSKLAPYKGERFYVFHPSFGYFAKEYGLIQEAVEIEGKSPSPRQLSDLIGKAKADKVKVIFTQPQFDQRSGQAIASAIQGNVVPLDPLAENAGENLLNMAQHITDALNR